MVKPFFSETTAAKLKQLARRGAKTTEIMQDPQEMLAFTRRDESTGRFTVAVRTLTPIAIAMQNQQPESSAPLSGGRETRLTGQVMVWTADVTDVSGHVVIASGDRFDWQGRPCRVDVVQPEVMGHVVIDFTLLGGSR